jgi:hypothetical protein
MVLTFHHAYNIHNPNCAQTLFHLALTAAVADSWGRPVQGEAEKCVFSALGGKLELLLWDYGRGACPHMPSNHPLQLKTKKLFDLDLLGRELGIESPAAAGVPGDPSTYYAGAASAGVWKSTDGGNGWEPIFDKQSAAAIGAIAVAPSDPSVIWVGTGEAWAIRDSDVMGNGVYVSLDAGKIWTHAGLDDTGRIGRILIDPKNPDIVFVCALGRATGPQQERGVYRTNDRGQHWERVLFADENTGCSGLTMDTHNPRVLFAGMWHVDAQGVFMGDYNGIAALNGRVYGVWTQKPENKSSRDTLIQIGVADFNTEKIATVAPQLAQAAKTGRR